MKPIKELKDRYAGRPIAVLGAGPNLPGDLERIPGESVLIGVNGHVELNGLARLDYVCFADSPKHRPGLMAWVDGFKGRRLTFIEGYSDWEVDGESYLYFGLTFPFAVWAALYMGGDPVILCGFDCHSTGGHFHEKNSPQSPEEYHKHMYVWRRVLAAVDGDKHRIKAASGPVVLFFEKYEKKEVSTTGTHGPTRTKERIRVWKMN